MTSIKFNLNAFFDRTFTDAEINKHFVEIDELTTYNNNYAPLDYTSYYLGSGPNQLFRENDLLRNLYINLARHVVFYKYKNGINDILYFSKEADNSFQGKDDFYFCTKDLFLASCTKDYLLSLHDFVPYKVYKKIYDEGDPKKIKKLEYNLGIGKSISSVVYITENPEIYNYLIKPLSKFIAFKVARTIICELITCPRQIHPEEGRVDLHFNIQDLFGTDKFYGDKFTDLFENGSFCVEPMPLYRDRDSDLRKKRVERVRNYDLFTTELLLKNIQKELKIIFDPLKLFEIIREPVRFDSVSQFWKGDRGVRLIFKNGSKMKINIYMFTLTIVEERVSFLFNYPNRLKLNGGALDSNEELHGLDFNKIKKPACFTFGRNGANAIKNYFKKKQEWKEIYAEYFYENYKGEAENYQPFFGNSSFNYDNFASLSNCSHFFNTYDAYLFQKLLQPHPFNTHKFEERKEKEFFLEIKDNPVKNVSLLTKD